MLTLCLALSPAFATATSYSGKVIVAASECAADSTEIAIDQKVFESSGVTKTVTLTGAKLDNYKLAWATVTKNNIPDEIDMLKFYDYSEIGSVFITGFKEGCFVGAVRVPPALHAAVLELMIKDRL